MPEARQSGLLEKAAGLVREGGADSVAVQVPQGLALV
jgi:hypothetical protein